MLASELWAQININTLLTGTLKEHEALHFLNYSIDYINDFLIEIKDSTLCKDINITTGMDKPSDWGEAAGTFPFHFNGDKFVSDLTPGPVKARYFARKPRINVMTDEFPFTNDLASIVSLLASIYAANRMGHSDADDIALLQDRLDRIRAARGV